MKRSDSDRGNKLIFADLNFRTNLLTSSNLQHDTFLNFFGIIFWRRWHNGIRLI